MKTRIITFLLLTVFSAGILQVAEAIPAFARKYRISCTTCHNPIPRLKAYGEDFAGDGFRLADQESPGYYIDTGDDELFLLRQFPLAARLEGHAKFNYSDKRNSDLATPYLVKLISGGEISKKFSYYFYFYMDERGEVAGVEDAYIFYNNLLGSEADVAFGQFAVSDPLFKRELRLTLDDYAIYQIRPGISNIRLSYDRGIMLTHGFKTGTDLAFEVVNGNGLADADAAKIFDNDDYKNFAGRISQSFGEVFRVGGFGYWGKEELGEEGKSFTNEMYYWGADMTLGVNDKLELNIQYLFRNDGKMAASAGDVVLMKDVETQGGFAELIYTPKGDKSKWYLVALANWVDSDLGRHDYKSATFHAGYLARRNIRFTGEITYDFSYENTEYLRGSVGIITVF